MTSTIKKVVFDDVPNIDKHKSSATFPDSEIEVVDLELPKHNDSLIYVDIVNGYLNIPYITTDSIKDLLQRLISEKKTDFYKYAQGLSNLDEYFIYLTVVDITRSDLTLDEKIEFAKKVMDCDPQMTLLYTTPVLKNGTIDIKLFNCDVDYNGDYLEYYNPEKVPVIAPLFKFTSDNSFEGSYIDSKDYEAYIKNLTDYYSSIMNKNDVYSERFKSQVYGNLDRINLIYNDFENKDYAAFCSYFGDRSEILMDLNTFLSFDDEQGYYVSESSFDFLVNSYTHELAHAYANATPGQADIDDSLLWEFAYNFIQKCDSNNNFLREYAFSSPNEMFAECVAEYYADPHDMALYNPNDLK